MLAAIRIWGSNALLVNICVTVKWHDLEKEKKKERLFLGKQKRILGMLFAMVTQLSLINLSRMKQVPDYNTLKQGSVPGGLRPLGCSTSYLQGSAQCRQG